MDILIFLLVTIVFSALFLSVSQQFVARKKQVRVSAAPDPIFHRSLYDTLQGTTTSTTSASTLTLDDMQRLIDMVAYAELGTTSDNQGSENRLLEELDNRARGTSIRAGDLLQFDGSRFVRVGDVDSLPIIIHAPRHLGPQNYSQLLQGSYSAIIDSIFDSSITPLSVQVDAVSHYSESNPPAGQSVGPSTVSQTQRTLFPRDLNPPPGQEGNGETDDTVDELDQAETDGQNPGTVDLTNYYWL